MGLSPKFSLQRFGSDGKSMVLKDDTFGYGIDGNPPRQDVALVFYNWLLDAQKEYSLKTGTLYYIHRYFPGNSTPIEVPGTPLNANAAKVSYPLDGVYRTAAFLIPLSKYLSNGRDEIGRIVYDEVSMSVAKVVSVTQGPSTILVGGDDGMGGTTMDTEIVNYSYNLGGVTPEEMLDSDNIAVATSFSLATYGTHRRLGQLLFKANVSPEECDCPYPALAELHRRLEQCITGIAGSVASGYYGQASENLAKVNKALDRVNIEAL